MPREHGPSKAEWFHDQRGRHHDAAKLIIEEQPTTESQKEILKLERVERMAAERLLAVLPEIKDDDRALVLVWAIIDAARAYADALASMGMAGAKRGIEEAETYRQEYESADRQRTRKHDLLIDALRAYTRYVTDAYGKEELPRLRIYAGMGPGRREIGEWGLALAKAAYAMPKNLRPYFKDIDRS